MGKHQRNGVERQEDVYKRQIVDLLAYVRRVRALRDLTRSIRVSIERLPEPRDGVEGAYDALLRELWDEKSKLDAEYAASRREAEDRCV